MNEIDEARRKSNLLSLHILLVISFVVSGSHLLSYLLTGTSLPFIKEEMLEVAKDLPDQFALIIDKALAVPQWYYLVAALLNVASVVGLTLMWKLKGSGFHCYTISKLLLMLMPLLFLDRSYIGIGDIMMAILFIVYYFVLLRMLGVLGGKNSVTSEESVSNTNDTFPEGGQEGEK